MTMISLGGLPPKYLCQSTGSFLALLRVVPLDEAVVEGGAGYAAGGLLVALVVVAVRDGAG